MGKVIVTIRIVPENKSIEELESVIKEKIKPEKIERKPFVFGLEALIVEKIVEDKENEMNELESKLQEIGESFEIINITRVFLD
ncbi:MAG: hypothetical protein QXQ14_02920 [Candidatus Aenigmatarchaeota archaeon]